MKRIITLLSFTLLTGALLAQPGGRPGGRPGGERPRSTTGPVMPQSLRLGLIESLGRIGTNEAEAVLVKTLKVTARGVEVAMIDRMLTKIGQAEDGQHKYTKEVIEAAKYLILNPTPAPDIPTRLDLQAEGELWAILVRYKDATFAEEAAKLLVNEEGELNRQALNYFRQVNGKDAVPVLATAYKAESTSDRAKGEIWGLINDYLDESPAAGQVFVQRFAENLTKMAEEEAARKKAEAERAANGGNAEGDRAARMREMFSRFGNRGGGGGRSNARRDLERLGQGKDLPAEAITNRRSILAGVKGTSNDADIQAMITSVETRLDELANPNEETSSRYRLSDPRDVRREEERRREREQREQERNNSGGTDA